MKKTQYNSIKEYIERWDELMVELKTITKLQRIMSKKLEALFTMQLLLEPLEAEETQHGNIIVPDMGNEKNQLGESCMLLDPDNHTIAGAFTTN